MRTFWLSMHVAYACRHAGACCTAGWPVPIERSRVARVGLLRGDGSWLREAPGAPEGIAGVLAVSESGQCVFHRDGCEIHRAWGHGALPSACQHFPREVLIDGRGTFVSLSHYCPTAADLLFSHSGPVTIVEGPPALPEGQPEGLDARDVLPPLLRTGVLMDLDAYAAWEAHMIRELTAGDGRSAEEVLAQLEADLGFVQQWRPGGAPLVERISCLSRRRPRSAPRDAAAAVVRRYLAARAFASWMPYQGGGVRAVLTSLGVTLSILRQLQGRLPLKDAIRHTDLQVVHLLPRAALAAAPARRG